MLSHVIYRRLWADYLDGRGVRYAFFSAANAIAVQSKRQDTTDVQQRETPSQSKQTPVDKQAGASTSPTHAAVASRNTLSPTLSSGSESSGTESESDLREYPASEEDVADCRDPRSKILTVPEVEDFFEKSAPELSGKGCPLLL
jgi:large subunit GTPase 1